MPADGTYFIEVDSFHFGLPEFAGEDGYGPSREEFDVAAFCTANPDAEACHDTDTGNYELFIYRFDAGHATDGGDMLDGRDGNDVLFGFSGDDTFTAGKRTECRRRRRGNRHHLRRQAMLTSRSVIRSWWALVKPRSVSIEEAILEGGASANVIDVSSFTVTRR